MVLGVSIEKTPDHPLILGVLESVSTLCHLPARDVHRKSASFLAWRPALGDRCKSTLGCLLTMRVRPRGFATVRQWFLRLRQGGLHVCTRGRLVSDPA